MEQGTGMRRRGCQDQANLVCTVRRAFALRQLICCNAIWPRRRVELFDIDRIRFIAVVVEQRSLATVGFGRHCRQSVGEEQS